MHISVAICTWNRADMLRDTLNSLKLALAYTRDNVEIIVVNNNSTDATDDVIATAMRTMPVRRVFESNPGVSNARNTAVTSATGEFIVWTDDDVIVQPNWLHEYGRAFESYPGASFFGGPILPRFDDCPPQWLTSAWDKICHVYAARDLGAKPLQIECPKQLPFGANFAVRTQVQRLFQYAPALGRQPSNLGLCGEEIALLESMLAVGHVGRWIPTASVEHRLTKARMTIRSLIKHGIGMGRSMVKMHPESDCSKKLLFGTSKLAWRKFVRAVKKAVVCLIKGTPNDWVPAVHRASVLAGRLCESIGKHRVA